MSDRNENFCIIRRCRIALCKKVRAYLKVLKEFRDPRSSLFRFVNIKEKNTKKAASSTFGPKSVFLKKIEYQLQKPLVGMEARLYPFTKNYVCSLPVRNKIFSSFKDEIADKDWFYAFMKRNPGLSVHKPLGTSFTTARGFSTEEVGKFFDQLDVIFREHIYPPIRIYNVGETSLPVAQNKVSNVMGLEGNKLGF